MKKNRHDENPHPGRRTFLKAAAGFMGSTLLGGIPFRAFAQAAQLAPADRCFVFVYFNGGWDQLLAFDPRDPDEFTADRASETKILPGYNLINDSNFRDRPILPAEMVGKPRSNIDFGPAVGDALAKHYDRMTVIRGINMNTLGHEVGYRYFLTGKIPIGSAARGSSTATEIVGQMSPTVPIPSISYNVESYNDRYPGYANALRVSRRDDLLLTLRASSNRLDTELENQLINLRGEPVTCEQAAYGARGVGTTYANSQEQMRLVQSQGLDQAFNFLANTPEMAAVRSRYGLTDQGSVDGERGRAALVGTALKKGIAQCVTINLTGGLDTHFGTQLTHANNQRRGFNALASLVDDLRESDHPKGGKFLDRTTILVFSEFSRTPLINASGGRDHHLCNSCLLIGAGLKHNLVFGKSGDIGMSPGTFDLRTGAADPNGENIFPEHVIATVLASAGLDYSITRVEPLRPILA
ncbi:DUF1501 domain-containing protein [Pyxidicoccus fallax]|uniref:DUF1501 domain-containing protein n=1 Tax=Pyxidicoccus fallax TaxID=394095 RepID=A0A848LC68_9BACT|nr:DUF1501 domain-containing protein [Pyxidicoccus fallax]NMO16076.1 DUF1501 domain-containing protein [Pyxidicoccus fallax]NPC81784.1 DUF1501 domain-containing protein [Pyxidicoccus fallax]